MVKIECPICEEDVSSQDAIGLGDSFKRHLMDAHRMTSLACIDMNEGVGVGGAVEESTITERLEVEGSDATREARARVRDVTGAGTSEIGTERPSRRLTNPPGSARSSARVVDVTSPREELEDVGMTDPELVIKCPFCNSVFHADNDDELGRDLKGHWGDEHQIRPTIRAELGMSKAR